MIKVKVDGKYVETNYHQFSDGAITYKLQGLVDSPRSIKIEVDPKTPVNVIREEIEIICSCIKERYEELSFEDYPFLVTLHLPYLPYGRADRVFEDGNPEPLGNFLVWLCSKHFTVVETYDVHNMCALQWTDINWDHYDQLECFAIAQDRGSCKTAPVWDVVVAPDFGAQTKAATIAKHWDIPLVHASKKRDKSTGKITEIVIPNFDFKGKKVLIPDDIGDGCGTFIGLAKLLKQAGASEVELYLTHLIASKGVATLLDLGNVIDRLIYFQIIGEYINSEHVSNFNTAATQFKEHRLAHEDKR